MYLSTIVDDKLDAYLEQLKASGLYGDGESEIVAGFILAGIREAITAGIIKLRQPVEPEAEEAEAAPPPPRRRGASAPGHNLDDEIPF